MKYFKIEYCSLYGVFSYYFIAEDENSAMEKFKVKNKEFHSIVETTSEVYNHQESCVRF